MNISKISGFGLLPTIFILLITLVPPPPSRISGE